MWYASFASGSLHALAPYPLGRFPKLSLHFYAPTSELDTGAGDSPATIELDFASSAEVKFEVACAPRHWVRFVPPPRSGGLRTAAVAWLHASSTGLATEQRMWESFGKPVNGSAQKLPRWHTLRPHAHRGGLEQRVYPLSVFAALRVIKVQVKAASPTKRSQLTRSASWGPGQFE